MTLINIGNAEIIRFDWNFIPSHMYLVRYGDKAFVVDPVDTVEVKEFILNEGIKRCMVFLTHEHFDHISGVELIKSLCDCEVICSPVCAKNITYASKNLSDKSDVIVMFNTGLSANGSHIEPFVCTADRSFDGELRTEWCGHSICAVSTPGHSPGSICIILDEKYLFSGDSLLDVPTITRLPGGSREEFQRVTLPWLRDISGSVELVLPGHGEYAAPESLLEKYS